MKNQDLSVLKALLLREMEGGMCQECGGMMYEGMCQECGWMEEALHGGQKKLDVEEPFGKITGADFKALRAKKGMEEGGMEDSEARIAHMQKDYKEMYNLGYTTGYADAQRGSKPNPMNENDDSVKHFNSAPNKQDWIDQFYSALNAKLENEPELKAKAQEALEIMGDSGVIDMYGTFQPHVAVDPFLGDIDELISHYRSGLQENHEDGGTLKVKKEGDKYYWTWNPKSGKTQKSNDGFESSAEAQKDFQRKAKYMKENHEGQDHEVSMANNSIDSILWAANELKKYLGDEERDIPAWIQDHITNAENYILQAAKNFHDYGHEEDSEEEYGDEDTQDMSLASLMEAKKKPSAGLTKKQKSAIAKKAKAGKDVGKKGKGFEKVAAKAAKKYGSKERGQKVAAAAMWKAAAKRAK